MKDNFEVFTTHDKVQRDAIFDDMRANGDEFERKAVKFSSNEVTGKSHFIQYTALGKGGVVNHGINHFRPEYRSTFSVAYPKS